MNFVGSERGWDVLVIAEKGQGAHSHVFLNRCDGLSDQAAWVVAQSSQAA